MGQTLSEPVTSKETSHCQNNLYKVGSSRMQGWRVSMEDAHTHILALPDDPNTSFFGVYDGHGGCKIAEYVGRHLHTIIANRPEFKENNIEDALKKGFLEVDTVMAEDTQLKEELAGTTAVVVIIKDNTLYCANAGDSRSIASVNGSVEQLSFDHKPNNYQEMSRIIAAGGWVECNRVNGNLALSRALGDFIFKKNENKCSEEQVVTGLWAVINTAGICYKGKLDQQDSSQWDTMFKINVFGMLRTARTFMPLLKNKKGRLLTIGTSNECKSGVTGSVVYMAARQAVVGASASLGKEMSAYGVDIVTINTDSISSERLFTMPKLQKINGESDAYVKYDISAVPEYALNVIEEALLVHMPKREYVITKPSGFSNYLSELCEKFENIQSKKYKVQITTEV